MRKFCSWKCIGSNENIWINVYNTVYRETKGICGIFIITLTTVVKTSCCTIKSLFLSYFPCSSLYQLLIWSSYSFILCTYANIYEIYDFLIYERPILSMTLIDIHNTTDQTCCCWTKIHFRKDHCWSISMIHLNIISHYCQYLPLTSFL